MGVEGLFGIKFGFVMVDEIINKLQERKQTFIEHKREEKPNTEIYNALNERISEIEDIIYLIIEVIGNEQETTS